ncbi:MAG: primosomal protein DnaI [Lactobacillus sp.]
MQAINKILAEIMKENDGQGAPKTFLQEALADPEIQAFLKKHPEVDQQGIQNSAANLYSYYLQKKDPSSVLAGYVPHLIVNGNSIDLTFSPDARMLAQQADRRRQQRLELIALPKRLRNVSFKDLDIQENDGRFNAISQAIKFTADYQQNQHAKGFYLPGDFGVGKTMILAAMANRLAAQGTRVVFLHVPTFIADLSKHIQDGTVGQEVDRLAQAPVVIFDDIGAETLSQWARDDVLGVILQQRMDNVLPTFFSSNFDQKALARHFEETRGNVDPVKAQRLMQRVMFLAPEIVVSGPNRRLENQP